MRELTPAQQRIFDFVRHEIRSGRPSPTQREIATHFNFKSHRAAACHLEAIKRKGFLQSDRGKARSLRIIAEFGHSQNPIVDIPVFGSIPAGFSSQHEQQAEGYVSIDLETVGYGSNRDFFALRVRGDSMTGRHILPGDIVVFEHGREPRSGDIVAALIDRESTLKTFVMRNGKAFLRAENPRYPDFIPSEELMIQGVFRALIRTTRE
jgi:repressor LexA